MDVLHDDCEGWNFGPNMNAVVPVWDVASLLVLSYGKGSLLDQTDPNAVHEANLLMLDISKASQRLGWTPKMTTEECIALSADWYKRYTVEDVYHLSVSEIEYYVR